ncbi:MAG: sugar ABC transporter permease [Nitrososphaerales archaeon]
MIGTSPIFVGFDNFIYLLSYPSFNYAFLNSIVLAGIGVNLKMFLALIMAVLLNVEFRGRRIIRALLLLPWAIPMVPSLVTWRWMLDADYGFFNNSFALMGLPRIPFLGIYESAISMAVVYHIWRILPFYTLLLLAGLQSIPREIYESADVDGANWWQKFWRVTFPLIKPLYLIATLLSTIWTLGDFTTIWVLTRGAPADTTNVFATFAYKFAFQVANFGAAYATFVFLLPVIVILIIVLLRRIGD